MKRLQGGKVVDYDPFTEPIYVSRASSNVELVDLKAAARALVPDGSVSDVLEWVGDDPDRASTALEVELSKETPRSTLVDKLS